ncbi:MAG TPA: trypsin-like peptidase domain-containing protein, partial [Candidatus Saccharimonadales bacterium]|nr:trypsin-like peptidase domain-containing protein [Candidatus Saccharimonadales bacterium]
INQGTPGAVLGYPGGGNFTADPAAVMAEFRASGHNIYGNGVTLRDIYEVSANVIPGNSGGPLVERDGEVMGVIFAQSTTYNQVGYALAMQKVSNEINQAKSRMSPVSTGQCAE